MAQGTISPSASTTVFHGVFCRDQTEILLQRYVHLTCGRRGIFFPEIALNLWTLPGLHLL